MAAHSPHALRIASATHLHNSGDITSEQRDKIHRAARKGMPKAAAPKKKPKPPMRFGSLAPPAPAMGPLPATGAGHYIGTMPMGPDDTSGM